MGDLIRLSTGWRDLSASAIWEEGDASILVDMAGRNRSYEVYVSGRQVSREWSLDNAKARAEKAVGGACIWTRKTAEPVNATHYYFGPTTEFTTPTTYYVGERA